MQKSLISALIVAIVSGLAIGTQSALSTASGKVTGATLTGLLVNFFGGIAAGLLLLVISVQQGKITFSGLQAPTLINIIVSGLLGIVIIAGIAYALPKIGVAAGLSTLIAGQMMVAVVVDTFGLTGGEPIPLNWSRIGGLILLALGTWAILPRK